MVSNIQTAICGQQTYTRSQCEPDDRNETQGIHTKKNDNEKKEEKAKFSMNFRCH